MSELTNIHARAVKDLTTPTELPANPDALEQVKLVAGNFPTEYAGNEALTVKQIKDLATVDLESKKANKTDVEVALSNLSTTANKFYPTLSEANSHLATMSVNAVVTIGEEANKGLWYKATAGATTLTKSAYDPLTQANNYTNNKAIATKTEAVAIAKNYTDLVFDAVPTVIAPYVAQAEAAATAATISAGVFETPEAGVNPLTGVPDGAYFNVRSPSSDSYIDEYQNIGGSAATTGKSYLSALGVQQQEKPANTIKDARGKTQQQINEDQEQLNTILNKTGTTESLAESVDATPFLQALISAMLDGMTLDLLGKTFRVKKNTGFASDYPKGDQPCLVVKNKKNIKITNGKLLVKEHGQGAIEFINSVACVSYLTIEGAGNFPPLDGLTGRGEKSVAGTGWFDETMYNTGDQKNNSVDTSQKNTGGFGGNFPQWGGGTAPTWGMWNGGYIRNYGHGIYTNNSQITIDRCEIFGFNGSAVVATGGLGDALSTRVSVTNSDIHHCYTSGVEGRCNAEAVNRTLGLLEIHNNYIHDIGHPDALPTHAEIDPGYGICTSNNYNKVTGVKRYSITSNRIFNCKRKAVDAHHSYSTIVDGNDIRSCGHGVYIGISSANDLEDVVITNNVLRNIQYTKTHPASAIGVFNYQTDPSTGLYNLLGTATISNNQIYEVGLEPQYQVGVASGQGRAIDTSGLESINVTGNIIVNKERIGHVAINAGVSSKNLCVESIVANNSIRGKWLIGTFQRNTNDSDANTKGLLPAHANTGNIVFLDDYPLTGNQTCVVGDDIKLSGNACRLAAPSASDKLVVSSAPTGSSVTLLYDIGTKTLQPVTHNSSYAVKILPTDFNVSYNSDQIIFTIPTYLSNLYSATVQERAAIRTNTLDVNKFNFNVYSRTVIMNLLNVSSSGAQTKVNVADVVSGVLAITFGL